MLNQGKKLFTSKNICYIGLSSALCAVMAQISIPMPYGVPMTLQTFAITLISVILGAKLATASAFVYIFCGALGLPVLAGFTGGLFRFIGPTGGFLISFPLMAFFIGFATDHRKAFKGAFTIGLILGTTINYVFGTAMFCILTKSTLSTGITACVLPFIPTTIIKAVVAPLIGFPIRRRLF